MAITQHLVEDHKDARLIHDKVTGTTGTYEHRDENYFFCVLEDGHSVGFAIAAPGADSRYALTELRLGEKHQGSARTLSLLEYMLFELGEAGVKELVVESGLIGEGPATDQFLASRSVKTEGQRLVVKTGASSARWRLFRKPSR